ncbi:MAG: hypothetical protein LBM71_05260 [Elusimicrobiota bacterium]|jgi:hypothetical protein|nr:hypothetical protein [Elusimicrobiota bacterium]
MKKLSEIGVLFIVSLLTSLPVYADEIQMSGVLHNTVGVFSIMDIAAGSTFGKFELGAKSYNLDATKQAHSRQYINVYGPLSFNAVGRNMLITDSLTLGGVVTNTAYIPAFSFDAIYIYPNKHIYAETISSATSSANLHAANARALGDFTVDVKNAFDFAVSNDVYTEKVAMNNASNKYVLVAPRGDIIEWQDIFATQGDTYGFWSLPSNVPAHDDCDGNLNADYTCTNADRQAKKKCRDAFVVDKPTMRYSLSGGAQWSHIRGRSECVYNFSTNSCEYDSYKYKWTNGSNVTSLIKTSNNIYTAGYQQGQILTCPSFSNSDLGALCHSLCYNSSSNPKGICPYNVSCVVASDNLQTTSSGVSGQSGVNACGATGWQVGSGLECKNAWSEFSARVFTCGAGSGATIGEDAPHFQYREVQCGVDPYQVSPLKIGRYVLSYYKH